MRIDYGWKTSAGKIRSQNEDSLFAGNRVFAVFDGMGGASYGEVASLLATQTLEVFAEHDKLACGGPELEEALGDYITIANDIICEEMRQRSVSSMGAAAAVLVLHEDRASICNLGDCRIYRQDGSGLNQLSCDDRTKAPMHSGTVLTQHLGVPREEFLLEPHIVTDMDAQPGQIFLLCSDGLTDMLQEEKIREIIQRLAGSPAQKIADALVEAALESGGRDNVTALIVKLDENLEATEGK